MPQPVKNPEVGGQYWLTWWLATGKTPHVLFQCWKVQVLYMQDPWPGDPAVVPCVCAPVDPAGHLQGHSVDAWISDLYGTREDALLAAKEKFNAAFDTLWSLNDQMKDLGNGMHVPMGSAYIQ